MKEKFSRWDVADYLSTEEDIAEYLNACIEEDPGDGSLIRAALGDIARAKGMMDLAKKTGLLIPTLTKPHRLAYEQVGLRKKLEMTWGIFCKLRRTPMTSYARKWCTG